MINLTDRERAATSNIDERELEALIDQALKNERSARLNQLHPSDCGSYLATEFHKFERSLRELTESKSAKKPDQKNQKQCVPEEIFHLPFHR
ncbi:hypothetical protein [Tateyamaria sp.]|uniref:hypothetical protein n=1 Tax=Tateyamaria sp. TaxID=1929288 RepID=UPI00329AC90F